ncbi:MAG: VWA domain-containing protein [Hahellaceae bacterium]|nr:VWA domain-containing protein [Hahellaceae bacterium]
MNAINQAIQAFITHFHFIRPFWLLGLLLLPVTYFALSKSAKGGASGWEGAISPVFLERLKREKSASVKRQSSHWLLPLFILLISLSLAGPSWRELPQPVFQRSDNLVVVLDLSLSMLAADQSPNRLTAAKRKLSDLFAHRSEGQTALIVYSGSAFTVTPLTDDIKTVESMLPALDPTIMPSLGSRPSAAIKQALNLFDQSGLSQGRILLLTDGITDTDATEIAKLLDEKKFELALIALGTEGGAPIPLPRGGYLKDQDTLVVPTLIKAPMLKLATETGGKFQTLTLTDDDLIRSGIIDNNRLQIDETETLPDSEDSSFKLWQDEGVYLVFLLLPFALLVWRKGILFSLVFVFALPVSRPSQAMEWQDLWKTPDQQAQILYPNDPAAAAQKFERPDWKGAAYYRAGNYDAAIEAFRQDPSADGQYNLGNALAKSGKLKEALTAYESTLKLQPEHEDAKKNKAVVEELLKQQQNQSKSSTDHSQKNEESNKDSSESSSNGQEQKAGQNSGTDSKDQAGNESSSGDQGENGEPSHAANSRPGNTSDQPDPSEPSDRNSDSERDSASSSSPHNQDESNRQAEQANAQENNTSDTDRQSQEPSPNDAINNGALNNAPPESSDSPLSSAQASEEAQEKDQATEQWLRRIPDDPGGLLRRKFAMQYQERQSNGQAPYSQGEQIW